MYNVRVCQNNFLKSYFNRKNISTVIFQENIIITIIEMYLFKIMCQ